MDRTVEMRRWQRATLLSLLVGYGGYYLCRTNLSVIKPLLLEQYGPLGLTKTHLGWIGTVGTFCYAVGKASNGLAADVFGGRRLFLLGMVASVVAVLAFTLGASAVGCGLTAMLLAMAGAWAVNRYFQSMGWVALVSVSARWFPAGAQATVMGVLSLSYLFGDALAQAYLGAAIKLGAGWRVVMVLSAVTLAGIAWGCARRLRNGPGDVGLPDVEGRAEGVYGARSGAARPSTRELLRPLLASRAFWLYATMNFGLTMIRETFREWQPTFLHEVTHLDAGSAAVGSMLFPLIGGVAALVAGRWADRHPGRHDRVFVPMLVALTACLVLVSVVPLGGRPGAALLATSAVSFCLLAPYTLFSGVAALDLGGKVGSATAAGMIDAAGYLGGMLAGAGMGSLAQRHGWAAAFGALAAAAAATTVAGLVYAATEGRRPVVPA